MGGELVCDVLRFVDCGLSSRIDEEGNIRYKGRPGRVGYPSERSIPAFSKRTRVFAGMGSVGFRGEATSLMAAEGWMARSWVADGAMIVIENELGI